jgi:hypothetical protein
MFSTNGAHSRLLRLHCADGTSVIGLIHLTQIIVKEFKKQNSGVS